MMYVDRGQFALQLIETFALRVEPTAGGGWHIKADVDRPMGMAPEQREWVGGSDSDLADSVVAACTSFMLVRR